MWDHDYVDLLINYSDPPVLRYHIVQEAKLECRNAHVPNCFFVGQSVWIVHTVDGIELAKRVDYVQIC